jgi:hypothetical protein
MRIGEGGAIAPDGNLYSIESCAVKPNFLWTVNILKFEFQNSKQIGYGTSEADKHPDGSPQVPARAYLPTANNPVG